MRIKVVMKVNLDEDVLNLFMPDCRELDIKPYVRVEEILLQYYSTKKVENEEGFGKVKK